MNNFWKQTHDISCTTVFRMFDVFVLYVFYIYDVGPDLECTIFCHMCHIDTCQCIPTNHKLYNIKLTAGCLSVSFEPVISTTSLFCKGVFSHVFETATCFWETVVRLRPQCSLPVYLFAPFFQEFSVLCCWPWLICRLDGREADVIFQMCI